MHRFNVIVLALLLTCSAGELSSQTLPVIITEKTPQSFPLVENGKAAPIYISETDYAGVLRVAHHFQDDVERVTGIRPEIFSTKIPPQKEVVIVGTIQKNALLQNLIKKRKINGKLLAGKWETYLITVVEKPLPGVQRALVIAGSDKRGAIYGMFELSEQMGVSPWYWWADVPPKKKENVYVKSGSYSRGEPKIKYRGFFINDEAPALTGWAYEKFGGYNHKFYEKVFELLLRLKGNYLWPAMWNNSFCTDDTLNPKLADEYGVVMGTSHHEPMMRAWKEWEWAGHPRGSWDYSKNDSALREFWREGIRRTRAYEKIVTLGMRGDGDEPMSDEANIALLEKIVHAQRQILKEVTGKKMEEIPQIWALYKEVQEYYDRGMRVPDDVTLLLCDDNWGNIRKLPERNAKPRKGGYGIYYHFDFVGGPRNYKWLNTNQIERVWEQMHLAYEYGARQLWIVNVGDIKPMEYPLTFFLDYAWNPENISANDLPAYTRQWAEKQFGREWSTDIAEILERYTKYNARKKPELLSWDTYSLVNYHEADQVVRDYRAIETKAKAIEHKLSTEYRDAFYQLILHPVEACANLNELYVTVGKNHLYAKQGRSATNELAFRARKLFENDALITERYHSLKNGKWNHMMSQTHIGYTTWQQPDSNSMPSVYEISLVDTAEMGVAVEGCESWFPHDTCTAVLPEFDSFQKQSYYIEVFNRGTKPYRYEVQTQEPWIVLQPSHGTVEKEQRIMVQIDWSKAPIGTQKVPIRVIGPSKEEVTVYAIVKNAGKQEVHTFAESNGYISIEAEHISRKTESKNVQWLTIPNLGRTLSAVTVIPVTASRETIEKEKIHLEYDFYSFTAGKIDIDIYLSPTLNFTHSEGLHYAVSVDDETPQIINIHQHDTEADWKYPPHWSKLVADNIRIITTHHFLAQPGMHTVKFWALDPGVVLQKIVLKTGSVRPSYLGPPESCCYPK
nr:GH115 [uncultured bacterium]